MSKTFTGVKRFAVLATIKSVSQVMAHDLPKEEGLRARSLSNSNQKMVKQNQHGTQFLYQDKKTGFFLADIC